LFISRAKVSFEIDCLLEYWHKDERLYDLVTSVGFNFC
jgi:hypothetical protein